MHIFFDLDNTLWDFDLNSYNVLGDLFLKFNLDSKLNTDYDSFYKYYKKKNDELWHLYYFKKIEKEHLRYKRFNDTFINYGLDDVELSKQIAEEYVKISPLSKGLKPGCIETLEHLSKKHVLHIITNGFKEVQHIKIDNCGLRPYFKEIIISEEYGLTKPDVRIFNLSQEKAKAVKEDCIMIGDNWVSDIEGAIGAGWRAVFYKVNERALFDHPNLTSINHLSELTQLY